ncbi:MAG TPA: L-threonylcarbamoyladenylate synthase [Bacillota bacterium]|nr:L-threonylcarbamoyladenylate synthase [Bacillota bacterium]
MKATEIVKVDPNSPDIDEIKRAAAIIKAGGLVAFPTETVYGLGADGLKADTVDKIFLAKGRPQDNPLILHVASPDDILRVATEVSPIVDKLVQLFWPGPLTLVLPKQSHVPDKVSAGLPTIGVRMPDNIIALTLIAESGTLLAAPSANLSGRPSPTLASHVADDMWGKVDLILDGGPTRLGVESTVLDLMEDPPRILRPGSVTREELEDVLGHVEAQILKDERPFLRQVRPGGKYPHYTLDIPFFLVEGEPQAVIRRIQEEAGKYRSQAKKVGVMCSEESKGQYLGCADVIRSLGSRHDMTQIAAGLYRTLRDFETCNVHVLFAEGFSERGLGFAVMNRLREAARSRIIYA